ncbi:8428_t:CDS:2 [Acaulospora morrowiae]|uniref:8428_t:CDS:1 n=1 Tax=Acaulospora morrowiae TaxID=94023 RepID=A0A9N8VBQ4_9GLOM|nr:8428_t:CDS:2 [Acaulospora morrowiae]
MRKTMTTIINTTTIITKKMMMPVPNAITIMKKMMTPKKRNEVRHESKTTTPKIKTLEDVNAYQALSFECSIFENNVKDLCPTSCPPINRITMHSLKQPISCHGCNHDPNHDRDCIFTTKSIAVTSTDYEFVGTEDHNSQVNDYSGESIWVG